MADSPALSLLAALGVKPAKSHAPYVAEAGQFQSSGLPTVICGPGFIDQAHKPNEFIALEQLNQGEQLLRSVIQRLTRS
jgi:acetylornithine deacetylase